MSSLTRKFRFLRASTTSPSSSTFSSTAMDTSLLAVGGRQRARPPPGSHSQWTKDNRHGLARADCTHRGGVGRQLPPVYEVAPLQREILGVCGIAPGEPLTSVRRFEKLRLDAEPSRRERGQGVVRPAAL